MVSSDSARLAFENHDTPFSYDKIRLALDDDNSKKGQQYASEAIDEAGCMVWLLLSEVGVKAREHSRNRGGKRVEEEDIIAAFDDISRGR